MNKIYSNIENNKLLHIIVRSKASLERVDLCPSSEFIQVAKLNMDKGRTFQPHKHIIKNGEQQVIAQESWIVVRGKVKVILYDMDDTLIHTDILESGDCSITFYGGHNYEILEDDTLVYEYKTGPYKGQKLDKVFI